MRADHCHIAREVSPAAASALWLVTHRRWYLVPLQDGGKFPRGGCQACKPGRADHVAAECPCLAADPVSLCHGIYAASNDPTVTRFRAALYPHASWAVHCGASGLLGVDIDCKPGLIAPEQPLPGREWTAALAPTSGVDCFGQLAPEAQQAIAERDTLTVQTPSGGLHLIYAAEAGRWKTSSGRVRTDGQMAAGALAWQVDVKARGGYLLIPGSATAAGTYRRISAGHDPAPLPAWLAGELRRTGHDATDQPQRTTTITRPAAASRALAAAEDRNQRYAAAALESACAELAGMEPNSGRNRKLYRSASRLAGMADAGWIDRGEVEAALADAARQARLPAGEISYAIASGFRSPRRVDGAR
jgi:hypothetical protein